MPCSHRRPPFASSLRSLAAAFATLALLAAPAGAATFAGAPVVGPSPQLESLDGLDVALDGSGALVTTQRDGGADHVFVSVLDNGSWSAPQRVDGGLPGASARPVVAVANGGRVQVAFTNDGNLYATTRPSAGAGFTPLQTVWGGGGASLPSLDVSVNGKGFLAFTAPGAGGHDVRVAASPDGGPWTLAPSPLDGNPNADAGVDSGRARVAVSADGTAIVAWGEGGHVMARRVRGTQPSVVFADAAADLVVEGVPAAGADLPVVGAQDDDSFTGVAFRATFTVGGAPRTRVVYRRLRGSRFEGPTTIDAAPFASGQGSENPQITTVGNGNGIVLGSNDTTFLSYAMLLRGDVGPGTVSQIDSVAPSTVATDAVAAAATPLKMLVGWQFTPATGAPEIRARYYDGTAFETEQVLSRPEFGPTVADDGIAAAGDDNGDIVVAYVQDVPSQGPAVSVATIDQPPGRFAVQRTSGFLRTDRPRFRWTISKETWGRYFSVAVDGAQVGVTGRRDFRPPPLTQGAHRWQVTAVDARGQTYVAPAATVRIDSVAPALSAKLATRGHAGAPLRLTVRANDRQPVTAGAPPIQTSGVKQILVDWGDGTRIAIVHGNRHVYRRRGRFRVRIVVTDRAGNRRTLVRTVRIARAGKKRAGGKARAPHRAR
jgi:hypothetical protein